MPLRSILRSFGHRNFRLFFTGQGLSLIGTQVQLIALPWFVYRITGSAQWLGWVSFAGQFPAVFATPIAGVIADRVNKRKLLLLTQTLAMTQAALLAALALAGRVNVWHVVVLNAGMSLISAFDLPTRQALLNDIVDDRADLSNAIALNSSIFNATRLIGPALAGFLIGWIGEGGCFLVNAASFLAVLVALLAMDLPHRPPAAGHPSALTGLLEGFRYAAGSMPIRCLLLLVTLVSFLAVPYNVLVPVLVRQVFDGDARLNGWLFSAAGLGALSGGLFLASRRSALGMVRKTWLLPILSGLALVGLSFSSRVSVSLTLIFLLGLTVVMLLTTCNMILQSIVPDQLRGRLVSLYALTFMGTAPLGGALAGDLTERFGVLFGLRLFGATLAVAGLLFAVFLSRRFSRRVTESFAAKLEVAEPDLG